jgi:hypothetical protein
MYTSTFETPNVVFFVSYLDYPSDIVAGLSTEALLDRVRNGHLQNRKMRSGRPITMAGHPGRELVAETQDGVVLVIRSLFVGPRLYQCIVEGRPGVENDPDTRKFLESFALR